MTILIVAVVVGLLIIGAISLHILLSLFDPSDLKRRKILLGLGSIAPVFFGIFCWLFYFYNDQKLVPFLWVFYGSALYNISFWGMYWVRFQWLKMQYKSGMREHCTWID